MNNYYYLQLNHKQRAYYKKIINAVVNGDSDVRPSAFVGSEDIIKIIKAVNYDHPELFYVDFQHLNFLETQVGTIYQINYIVKASNRTFIIEQFEKKISGILKEASQSNLQGEYEKCRWIHNYLIRHIKYNYEALRNPDEYLDSFNVKGAIIDGLAVCEGISKAFKLLCDRLGVNAMIVFGKSTHSNFGVEISHVWNMVRFNDEYMHVDVTWDLGMSKTSKFVRYDYFCVSDRWMLLDHEYSSFPVCKTDEYSYFLKRKRYFISKKELIDYLNAELKKGTSILYFKINVSKDHVVVVQDIVQKYVSRSISLGMHSIYYLEMMPNSKQMCFFFRIKQ